MTEAQLADLSRLLFSPVTIVLYAAAMFAYFYAMAFTRVDRDEGEAAVAGSRGLRVATAIATTGVAAHLAHLIVRSAAAGWRVPWGNMFEFSSVMGFGVVAIGLVVFQWRMRRFEVMGFLLLGALLTMGAALLVYSEPGPLMPILDSEWLKIHVFAIMTAATIFTVGFVFNALYLLRDAAERRVAEQQTALRTGSTVGAAYAGEVATRTGDDRDGTPAVDGEAGDDEDHDPLDGSLPERDTAMEADGSADRDLTVAEGDYGLALRRAVARPVRVAGRTIWFPAKVAVWSALVLTAFSLVFQRPAATAVTPVLTIGAVYLMWRFLDRLPSASTLDSLAYRTIAFAFPIWTFAVIAGAIWAEQSWGRYWGWDPKETSAFLTWVAYAGYLHARATRGMRGRKAAWFGVVAFGVLLFTYFVVNLLITGLHSYAGL